MHALVLLSSDSIILGNRLDVRICKADSASLGQFEVGTLLKNKCVSHKNKNW